MDGTETTRPQRPDVHLIYLIDNPTDEQRAYLRAKAQAYGRLVGEETIGQVSSETDEAPVVSQLAGPDGAASHTSNAPP